MSHLYFQPFIDRIPQNGHNPLLFRQQISLPDASGRKVVKAPRRSYLTPPTFSKQQLLDFDAQSLSDSLSLEPDHPESGCSTSKSSTTMFNSLLPSVPQPSPASHTPLDLPKHTSSIEQSSVNTSIVESSIPTIEESFVDTGTSVVDLGQLQKKLTRSSSRPKKNYSI
ncbi:hypothetical protein GEMRC1_004246 [Eukaryota sp. GEM-RC1]